MHIQSRESGLALIVTLLLGLIAAGFIGAMMYALGTGSRISGIEARYTSSLQAAKGGASYITSRLGSSFNALECKDAAGKSCDCDYLDVKDDGEKLKCPTSTNSSFADSVTVYMDTTENLGDYKVSAELVSAALTDVPSVYSFELTANSTTGTEERSEIEFVYKIK